MDLRFCQCARRHPECRDGTPVGLADIKSLLEKLPNKIINKLGIVSDVNKCSLNGIDYIEIAVHPSNVAITLDGVIYYRSGATNQTLRGEALERFLLSDGNALG